MRSAGFVRREEPAVVAADVPRASPAAVVRRNCRLSTFHLRPCPAVMDQGAETYRRRATFPGSSRAPGLSAGEAGRVLAHREGRSEKDGSGAPSGWHAGPRGPEPALRPREQRLRAPPSDRLAEVDLALVGQHADGGPQRPPDQGPAPELAAGRRAGRGPQARADRRPAEAAVE